MTLIFFTNTIFIKPEIMIIYTPQCIDFTVNITGTRFKDILSNVGVIWTWYKGNLKITALVYSTWFASSTAASQSIDYVIWKRVSITVCFPVEQWCKKTNTWSDDVDVILHLYFTLSTERCNRIEKWIQGLGIVNMKYKSFYIIIKHSLLIE